MVIRKADYISLLRCSTPEVIARISGDVYDVGDLIIKPICLVCKDFFIFIWASIFLCSMDLILFLCCVPLGFLMLAVGEFAAKKIYH